MPEQIDHDIQSLSISADNELHKGYSGSEQKPYMATPRISIVETIRGSAIGGETCNCDFRLNADPCEIWRKLFRTHIQHHLTQIREDELKIQCSFQEFDMRLGDAKEAIAKTNIEYATERDRLIALIREREQNRTEDNRKKQETQAKLDEKLRNLKL